MMYKLSKLSKYSNNNINATNDINVNNVYRVRFFSSFCKSENVKGCYENLCEAIAIDYYGPNKKIYFTNDDDYTHVIILNVAMPVLKPIPRKNVIGLSFEPTPFLRLSDQFIKYAQKNIYKYYIGDKYKYNLSKPFVEGFGFQWHITPLTYLPIKNKCMSIICSEKKTYENHAYRHTLVKKILESNLPIDIYGRGCQYYNHLNDTRVKGEFNSLEPIENYDFHICIENFVTNYYASEKIMDPLFCSTTPIYLGCKNIKEIVGDNDNIITLSGNADKDFKLLTDIINNPSQYKKNINIDEIKDKLNLIKNIEKLYL